jgi:hypothetical protein
LGKLAYCRLYRDVHGLDVTVHFAGDVGRKRIQYRRRALDNYTHAAVRQVLNETRHRMPRGNRPRGISKPHALHASGKVNGSTFHGDFVMHAAWLQHMTCRVNVALFAHIRDGQTHSITNPQSPAMRRRANPNNRQIPRNDA